VVAEKARSVKGCFLERVGHLNPLTQPNDLKLDIERIEHWIKMGAIPSQTAARIFNNNGIKSAEKYIKARVMKPSKVAQRALEEKAKKEAEKAESLKAAAAELEAAEKANAAAEVEPIGAEAPDVETPVAEETK